MYSKLHFKSHTGDSSGVYIMPASWSVSQSTLPIYRAPCISPLRNALREELCTILDPWVSKPPPSQNKAQLRLDLGLPGPYFGMGVVYADGEKSVI